MAHSVEVNTPPEALLRAAADLPREPFRLTAVHLTNNQRVSDAGLPPSRTAKI